MSRRLPMQMEVENHEVHVVNDCCSLLRFVFGPKLRFFNPIEDVTDRIFVAYERIDGEWFEVDDGGGIDVELAEWLQAQVEEFDAGNAQNCSSNYYVSDPISIDDAMMWNHDIAMNRPFPWGTVFGATAGTVSGAALGFLCEKKSLGTTKGACALFFLGVGSGGGTALGALIDRYRERSGLRPPLTCGDRLLAIETICTGWIDSPNLGPREVQSSSIGFTSLPGPC